MLGRLLDGAWFARHALALEGGAAVGPGREAEVQHPERPALLGAGAQSQLGNAVVRRCRRAFAQAAEAENRRHGRQRRGKEQPLPQKFHENPAVSSVPDRSISPNPAKSSLSSSSEIR